jgi:glutamyl-tRNA reductase
MSLLVVGLSHKSAPVALLERAAVTGDAFSKLLHDVHSSPYVDGTFVVSTCNRVEVYADVEKFHGGVSVISELLARHAGIDLADLTRHLYVHYEERAVQHLFAVACGLDSMVAGEGQILGQVRKAVKRSAELGTLGRLLSDLGRLALRAGKRAHTETAIDRAGASMVSVALDVALGKLHTAGAAQPDQPLAGTRTLVVGAGSMSSLAATTAARAGAAPIVIANRTPANAQRLAASIQARTAGLAGLSGLIAEADLVISCTGASELVITAETAADGIAARAGRGPLVFIDLALPRDVDPALDSLPGAVVIGLDDIAAASQAAAAGTDATAPHGEDIAAVKRIVAEEVAAHASAVHAARVTPTVVALRAKAANVVDTELVRLAGRLASTASHDLDEIAQAMRRVVDKLLHAPTVRVKELAGSPGGDSYAAALRELFDLDPKTVEAVTRADADLGSESSERNGSERSGGAGRNGSERSGGAA